MLAKDQTRLRIEKMEAEREQRRINAAASRYVKLLYIYSITNYLILLSITINCTQIILKYSSCRGGETEFSGW